MCDKGHRHIAVFPSRVADPLQSRERSQFVGRMLQSLTRNNRFFEKFDATSGLKIHSMWAILIVTEASPDFG